MIKRIREITRKSMLGKGYIFFRKEIFKIANRRYISKKEQLILKYKRIYGIRVFVETGTYRGDMIKAMLEHFDSIYSIELGTELFQKAVTRFYDEKKVHLFQGDSAKIIHEIDKMLSVPRIYWLDAHYSGGVTVRADIDTPINDELNAVLRDDICSIILIDDARLFDGTNGYPMIRGLFNNITKNYPSLNFKVSRDVIQIFPKNRAQITSITKSRQPQHHA